ncbi:MAG: phosphate regulon transcriptional regulator PhoB [Gammaproteobacteria bacterium]|jgi:phosphate regulon transcriptional regulator PhoB
MSQDKIVVVEDEPDILEVFSYNLKREGFEVATSLEGSSGLKLIQQNMPDLVLLDLMLPGMDGLDICRHLKGDVKTQNIPIIMVTAKGEESDIVLGLGLGADDYITKPFSPKELIARVKAVLRRVEVSDVSQKRNFIKVGDLEIDISKHKVILEDNEIKMTATEFRLLSYLMSQSGRVFSREQLLNQAFGNDVVVVDRNIDVHIRAIRKKTGENNNYIETIRGVGYRFKDLG